MKEVCVIADLSGQQISCASIIGKDDFGSYFIVGTYTK